MSRRRSLPPRLQIRIQSAKEIESAAGHCEIDLDVRYDKHDDRPEADWPKENIRVAGILARIVSHAEPFIRAQRSAHQCQSAGRVQVTDTSDPLRGPSFLWAGTGEPADICEVYQVGLLAGEPEAGIGFIIPAGELAVWQPRILAWMKTASKE